MEPFGRSHTTHMNPVFPITIDNFDNLESLRLLDRGCGDLLTKFCQKIICLIVQGFERLISDTGLLLIGTE